MAERKTDPILDRVVSRFHARSQAGIDKYGTTLHDNPAGLLEWLNHLQEELMDATLYIERIKEEQAQDEINKL